MMTELSVLRAAKADPVEKSWVTPEASEEETADESPPLKESPQVMTEPSSFSAAKARPVEKSWVTPEVRVEETADESPPA